MEIWKKIEGFDYPYEVSSLGNIRNGNRVLKFRLHTGGYNRVSLIKNKSPKDIYVHRLVAKYFVNGYSESLVVNHIDGNKKNNSYINLENITTKENVIHAIKNGLSKIVGENYRLSKLSRSDVSYITSSNKKGVDLAKEFCVSPAQISRIRNNKSRKYEHVDS